MLSHIQGERGFSHGRPRCQNDEVSGLQTRGHAIEIRKPGGHTGDHFALGIELIDQDLRGCPAFP